MNLYSKFRDTHPHAFFVDEDNPESIQNYLRNQGWIDENKQLESVASVGEQNLNNVLRLTFSDGQSVIIKQSRPWVESLPDIPAPAERCNIEAAFLQETARNDDIASRAPNVLHFDEDAHIILMEDLGDGNTLINLYESEEVLQEQTLVDILEYLSALHQNFAHHSCNFYIENRGMRKLKAEHMFRFPFVEDNGLDLDEVTPGLAEVGEKYRNDEELMEQVAFMQYRYLQNGETLLHGDFWPGNMLRTANGIKIIGPEYCFFGDAEFDLGMLYAHLHLARQPEELLAKVEEHYKKPPTFSEMLYQQYAGTEILRRILGLEQLPLHLNLEEKEDLLNTARSMLLEE